MICFNYNQIFIVSLLFILGCSSSLKRASKNFVEKNGNEDFSEFINTGFLIRGVDEDGNTLIFITTNFQNADKNGPYIVTLDKETGIIKKTSTHLMADSTFDKELMHRLLIKFLQYKVYSLAVDVNKNVYVRVFEAERPTLIRFSDPKYIKGPYKDFKPLKGNWYIKNK